MSLTSSLHKGKEEGISTNDKKVAVEDPESPTSSPGKGKEQGNSADDTKLVEEVPVSSTTTLDKDKEEGITTSGKKVAEEDTFQPTSSPGKGKEQGNSLDGTKEVEEDSDSSTSSVEKGKAYFCQGEQDSVSKARSFGGEQEQGTYHQESNKGFDNPLPERWSPGNNSGHVPFFNDAKAEVENPVPLTKSPVKYQEQDEQGENGDARLRKKPLSPMSDPTIASPPPKRSLITPSSPAGTDSSITMSLLTMPSLRHQKRKFSKQSTSTSASLFKHLTILKSGKSNKSEDDEGTWEKEKQERGKQSVIEIKKYQDATSLASHQRGKRDSALLPLSVSYRWYFDSGKCEYHNRSRADCRATNTMLIDEKGMNLATNRSRVIGRLEENIKVLQEKIDGAKAPKEKTRLLAIKAVGEHLLKNPIVPTQDAGQILAQESQQTIDGVTKRRLSMEIYEVLSKHLNVLQIYIWEKAFLMENRSSPLLDVVNNVKKIFDSFDVRSQLNAHIEEKIGNCYKTALAYLDTERPGYIKISSYQDN